MSTAWSKPTKYIVAVGVLLLGFYVLYLSRSVIPLLLIAALITVIVRPVITWLHERLRLPRGLAVALAYLVLAIIVPLAIVLVVPAIVNALQYILGLDYEAILQGGAAWLRETLTAIRNTQLPTEALDTYVDQAVDEILATLENATPTAAPEPPPVDSILQSLGSALTTTFGAAATVIGGVFSRVVLLIFIFLVSIYMSLSVHTYRDAFLAALPEDYQPEIAVLLERIVRVWNAFFRGQLTLMLAIGVMSWLGLTILGIPGALSLGIVAGLLEIIPSIGPLIATIPAVIVALLQGSNYLPFSPLVVALLVVGFYVLLQQVENTVIVPRVLGDAVDLPPLVVITGVLIGTTIAGILGALLATPVIATLREILRYIYRKLLGEDPFQPQTVRIPSESERTGLFHRLKEWRLRVFPERTPNPGSDLDAEPNPKPEAEANTAGPEDRGERLRD